MTDTPENTVGLHAGRTSIRILQDDQEIVLTAKEALDLADKLRRWGANPLGLRDGGETRK